MKVQAPYRIESDKKFSKKQIIKFILRSIVERPTKGKERRTKDKNQERERERERERSRMKTGKRKGKGKEDFTSQKGFQMY